VRLARTLEIVVDVETAATKRCIACGGKYLLEFFRLNASTNRIPGLKFEALRYRDRCLGCDAIRKRQETMGHRLRRKATTARRRHGARLKELGLIKNENDLDEVYGWSLDQMIGDIARVIEHGCPYCLQMVDVAEHGLGAVTVDILDVDQSPHYSTNVRWCCMRCNSEKQRTPTAVWGARKSMWALWRMNLDRLGTSPEIFGFLPYDNRNSNSQLTLF
jgi:hypothetical protein